MRLVTDTAAPKRTSPRTNLQEEAELRRAVRTARRTFSAEHPNVALAHLHLGDYFAHEHRFEEAETAFRHAAEVYETLGVGHELLLAIALRSLSQAICAQDRHEESHAISGRATQLMVSFQ